VKTADSSKVARDYEVHAVPEIFIIKKASKLYLNNICSCFEDSENEKTIQKIASIRSEGPGRGKISDERD
jgi:hypothetical protein